jgi:hypothetical protein
MKEYKQYISRGMNEDTIALDSNNEEKAANEKTTFTIEGYKTLFDIKVALTPVELSDTNTAKTY